MCSSLGLGLSCHTCSRTPSYASSSLQTAILVRLPLAVLVVWVVCFVFYSRNLIHERREDAAAAAELAAAEAGE